MLEPSNNIELMLAGLRKAKVEAEAAAEEVTKWQDALIGQMKAEGHGTVHTQVGGESISGTLVEATRIKVDEPRLQKAVGANTWGKITKRVLDKDKLEHAMAAGFVDPNVVATVSEEIPNKPYVLVTAKEVRKVRVPSAAARKTHIK